MNISTAILLIGGAILVVIGFYLPGITLASMFAVILGGFALGCATVDLFR